MTALRKIRNNREEPAARVTEQFSPFHHPMSRGVLRARHCHFRPLRPPQNLVITGHGWCYCGWDTRALGNGEHVKLIHRDHVHTVSHSNAMRQQKKRGGKKAQQVDNTNTNACRTTKPTCLTFWNFEDIIIDVSVLVASGALRTSIITQLSRNTLQTK